MRYLAGTLGMLVSLALSADLASAQIGRATGSRSSAARGSATGSGARTGAATGIGARTGASARGGARISPAPRMQGSDIARGRTSVADRVRSVPVRRPRSGSIGGRLITSTGGGGTMVRVGQDPIGGRTAVRREDPRAGRATGSMNQAGIGDVRAGGGRIIGGGSGVIRGSSGGVIQGSATGTRRYDGTGWGVRSGPYYGNVSYGRHVVFDPGYRTRFHGCPVSFVFGHHGLTCFHSFVGARLILPVPLFFFYPLSVVHIHSGTSYSSSRVVSSGYPVETESPGCAVVTVVLPGNDGYWKTLRLPVENAYTRDDLRRLISDRMRAGVAFTLQDVDGVRLEIPAGLQIHEVLVEPCR